VRIWIQRAARSDPIALRFFTLERKLQHPMRVFYSWARDQAHAFIWFSHFEERESSSNRWEVLHGFIA